MTMSKSVPDQNVEDMLSSVRRLVSNELPRNQRSRLPEGPGALVLTEAQRVAPTASRAESRGMSLEDRIAELEAAVDNQEDDWEPDGSEDQTINRPDRIVFRPSRPLTEDEQRRPLRLSEIALIETGPANEDSDSETGEDVMADTSEVSFRHEELQEEVPQDTAEVEAVGSEVAEETQRAAENQTQFAQDPFADAVARDVAAVVAEMAEAALTREVDFDSALAAAVDSVDDKPEADFDEGQEIEEADAADDDASTALESEATAVEPVPSTDSVDDVVDVDPVTEQEPPDAASDRPTSMSREDRARELNDETELGPEKSEALRPLVSAMIREELQGELGERITRNVRKLVRQEVNRALSVRDLE